MDCGGGRRNLGVWEDGDPDRGNLGIGVVVVEILEVDIEAVAHTGVPGGGAGSGRPCGVGARVGHFVSGDAINELYKMPSQQTNNYSDDGIPFQIGLREYGPQPLCHPREACASGTRREGQQCREGGSMRAVPL